MASKICECLLPTIDRKSGHFCTECKKPLEEWWLEPEKVKRKRGRPVGSQQIKTRLLERYAEKARRPSVSTSDIWESTIHIGKKCKVTKSTLPGEKPVIAYGLGMRVLSCPAVDFCLKAAIKIKWEKFNCEKCPRAKLRRHNWTRIS